MTDIYNKVTEVGLPNYHGAQLQLPSNMCVPEWEALPHMAEDTTLINFLKYGFPVVYEGPVPTPADHNNASALQHPRDVANYVLTEIEKGAMLDHLIWNHLYLGARSMLSSPTRKRIAI